VVDDNPDVAESLVMALKGLAREIRLAHGGAQALEIARTFKPEFILCDLGMPGMDGYETARRLRQLPELGHVVIAAVSGYGTEEDRQRARAAGFDHHFVKPVSRAMLEQMLCAPATPGEREG